MTYGGINSSPYFNKHKLKRRRRLCFNNYLKIELLMTWLLSRYQNIKLFCVVSLVWARAPYSEDMLLILS
ncbi:hypothetical protein FHG87_003843 [Trinorchestia longiramus]|nr:hypothetical protein FHG87_003843 [Trinorchestia longiramus]